MTTNKYETMEAEEVIDRIEGMTEMMFEFTRSELIPSQETRECVAIAFEETMSDLIKALRQIIEHDKEYVYEDMLKRVMYG